MRARPVYVAALLLALAGLAAYVVVPGMIGRSHAAALARAHRAAAAMADPPGSTARPPGDCQNAVRCLRSDADPDAVTAQITAALRATGLDARGTCEPSMSLRNEALRDCFVRAETGRGHGVFAFVHTDVRREGDTIRIDGSFVSITVS